MKKKDKSKKKNKKKKSNSNSPTPPPTPAKTGGPSAPGLYSKSKEEVGSIWKTSPKFPDFGKEVRRSFAVHEFCFDCVRFVRGCKGWRAKRKFECPKVKWYKKVKAG
jgi:hypothetical protein